MEPKEPLYNVRVESNHDHGLLLQVVGKRETVLDAALRVCLDSAPTWDTRNWISPMFSIHVQEIR